MPILLVDRARVYFEIHGRRGPVIVIPWCNFAWDSLDLALFTDAYTVVIASPRGFGNSDRVSGGYTAASIRADLEAVVDHLGVGEYISFGYSMTASVAASLAHRNRRVRAAVAGGFPLTSSYAPILPYVEANLSQTREDSARWSTLTRHYDPDALLAWYRYVGTLPAGGLIDQVDCPLYCYWGGRDEFVNELAGVDVLAADTAARRIPHEVIAGRDHEGLLSDINAAVPGIRTWLDRTLAE